MLQKVNLASKLGVIKETYSPKIVAELNGQYVKLVKLEGEYIWHHHEKEDEMFLVLSGQMILHLRDGDVEVNEGEFIVVPHGVEHKPNAPSPAEVLVFEPATTRNTGEVDHSYTIEPEDLEKI
jgi:mannose-6-phosphate isomerase-like protein (cupin superfamily)